MSLATAETETTSVDAVLCYPLFDKVYFTEPVGICMLAAFLQRDGYSVSIDDGFLRGDSAACVAERVTQQSPRLVGISMNAEREMPDGLRLAAELRSCGYKGLVIAGGAFAAMGRASILASALVDCVVIGDGEHVLADVITRLRAGEPLDGMPGVAFPGMPSTPSAGIRELDALPRMDRSVFRRMIAANGGSLKGIQATISTGRGCFANCAFCSIQQYARMNTGARYRERGVSSVIEEMRDLYESYGVTDYYFCTGQFMPPGTRGAERRSAELRDAIRTLPFTPSIFLYVRCDNVNETVVRNLRDAAVTTVFLGVESFDDAVLTQIDKGLTAAEIVAALETLELNGYGCDYRSPLRLKCGFIMFTPWSTLASLAVNARWCRRFRIPPKKMLYSLQIHPESQFGVGLRVIERDAVHFIDLEGAVGDVYRAYRDFFGRAFSVLERMRAVQKSGIALPSEVSAASWRIVDGVNQLAYEAFDAFVQAAGEGKGVSTALRSADVRLDGFLREQSLDSLTVSIAASSPRQDCIESHFNRGYDNPQVLDPRSVERGLRYP